jgi:hypothetical protein
MVINNQKGQSVVEYILLLAVVISLVTTFYNSKMFQRLFGENGSLGTTIKTEAEFGYRHAFLRNHGADQPIYQGTNHPSYSDGGATRFFGPKDPYP